MTHHATNYAKLHSWQSQALDPRPVSIEVLRSRGLSQLSLTGLPDAWLRDSRDKLRALVGAFASWGPLDRLLVHLLPADESKIGAHLELPIVLGCLCALSEKPLSGATRAALERYRFVGSLSLEGRLIATELSQVLEDSDPEGTLGPSRFAHLKEVWEFLRAPERGLPPRRMSNLARLPATSPSLPIEGLWEQRFWMLAACVVEMPTLLVGPPGGGKSHLARWASQAVPMPDTPLENELKQIWNLAGRRDRGAGLPPLIAPHSRTMLSEFLGHTRKGVPRPGLFSLAHGGTLILDEFAEMNHDCREILRTVLDQKIIHRQAQSESITWPARFWLIATANPCPCGLSRGEQDHQCLCPRTQKNLYRARLSGPMLDRFGLKVFIAHAARFEAPKAGLPQDLLEASPARLQRAIAQARADWPALWPAARAAVEAARGGKGRSEREIINRSRLLAAAQALSPDEGGRHELMLGSLLMLGDGFFRLTPPAQPDSENTAPTENSRV